MADEPTTPEPRGPLPGWEPPGAWGPPGPPAWGPPPGKRRFGVGALIWAGLGGAALGVIGVIAGLAILYAVLGDQADHPAIGTYPPLSESADQPKLGDCLSSRPSLADVTTDDEVVPCTDRHRSEVIAVVEIPQLVSRPTGSQLDLFVSEACSLAFRTYVGGNPATTDKEFGAIVPDRSAWNAGDRQAWCLLDSLSAGDGVGSDRRDR